MNDYYKNLNKHNNCSKCNNVLTHDNYKKGRSICKLCYNKMFIDTIKINLFQILFLKQMLVLRLIFQMNYLIQIKK